MVGRTAKKAVARIRPEFNRSAPGRQVFARAWHQPGLIDGLAIARRRNRHKLAVGRITRQIKKRGHRTYGVREGRVLRHIGYALAVQQHSAAIAQSAHILFAATSHDGPFLLWRLRQNITQSSFSSRTGTMKSVAIAFRAIRAILARRRDSNTQPGTTYL